MEIIAVACMVQSTIIKTATSLYMLSQTNLFVKYAHYIFKLSSICLIFMSKVENIKKPQLDEGVKKCV